VEDVDGASCAVDDMKKMEVLTILRSKSSRVESSRRDNDHATSLHLVARNGKFEVVQMLLNRGTNVHARDKRCQTPFDSCVDEGGYRAAP